MSLLDNLGGLLKDKDETRFDQVSSAVPSSVLGGALADMFRSNETPPFPQQTAQMFGNSNGSQKASLLNELMATAGPAILSMLNGSGMGNLAGTLRGGQNITPEVAEQVPPAVVEQMAEHAAQHDPSIVDKLGSFYSQHPGLVKTLGSAAVAITLAKLANRTE